MGNRFAIMPHVHNLLGDEVYDATVAACLRGAIITGQGAAPLWTRLAVGTAGQFLTTDGTDVSWGSNTHNLLSATHSDTVPASVVRGDILVGNATPKWERLAKGTSGYALIMGANDPAWTVIPTQTSALLSATHTDTTPTAVARGAIITGQGVSPAWALLAKGTVGQILTMGAEEPEWAAGTTTHNLLSATHPDTTAASAVVGDLITGQTGPVWARLAGDTSDARKFLRTLSVGGVATAPAWDALVAADVPGVVAGSSTITFAGPTAPRIVTLPDVAFTVAGLAVAQTWAAAQIFAPASAAGIPVSVRGYAAQTADLFVVEQSTGTDSVAVQAPNGFETLLHVTPPATNQGSYVATHTVDLNRSGSYYMWAGCGANTRWTSAFASWAVYGAQNYQANIGVVSMALRIGTVGAFPVQILSQSAELARFSWDGTYIQPSAADKIPLTVKGYASQTADIFVVEKSDGTDYMVVDSAGRTHALAGLTVAGTIVQSSSSSPQITLTQAINSPSPGNWLSISNVYSGAGLAFGYTEFTNSNTGTGSDTTYPVHNAHYIQDIGRAGYEARAIVLRIGLAGTPHFTFGGTGGYGRGDALLTLGLPTMAGPGTLHTIQASGGFGTNIAGSSLAITGGKGTGSGTPGSIKLQTSAVLTTGTTLQSLVTQFTIPGTGEKLLADAAAVGNPTLQSLREKALTETTATTICTVSVASGAYTGFSVEYTVVASDATDHQAVNGRIMVNAVNKAGTVTLDYADSQAPAICSAGTLTPVTVTAAASGNNVIVQITATSSLTQTVLKAYYLVVLTGPGTVTPA